MSMKPFWKEIITNIKANVVKEVILPSGTNTVIVRNPSGDQVIKMGLDSDTGHSHYEAMAQFDGWGFIVRPYSYIDRVLLVSSGDISRVKVVALRTENPMLLLQNMAQAPTGQVAVSATVGLKAGDMKLDAQKRLGVVLESSVVDMLKKSDLSFDAAGYLQIAVRDTLGLKASELNLDTDGTLFVEPKEDGKTSPPETPQVFNVVMAAADTQYSIDLPAGTKGLEISVQEGDAAFRFAFEDGKVAGKVAPYLAVPAGGSYDMAGVYLNEPTLYFAAGEAGKTMQVLVWL